jgi:hypothetical protein
MSESQGMTDFVQQQAFEVVGRCGGGGKWIAVVTGLKRINLNPA